MKKYPKKTPFVGNVIKGIIVGETLLFGVGFYAWRRLSYEQGELCCLRFFLLFTITHIILHALASFFSLPFSHIILHALATRLIFSTALKLCSEHPIRGHVL